SCRAVVTTVVDLANAQAVIRPTLAHTTMGTSGQVRYPVDLSSAKIYEIPTSPLETTYLLLPEGERLAAKLLLNIQEWEIAYGKSGAEGSRREVVAVRPVQAPLMTRGLLVLQSGLPIHLQLRAQERPGALSVRFDLPELAPRPTAPEVP